MSKFSTTGDEYRNRTLRALSNWQARQLQGEFYDLAKFPPETHHIVQAVCRLWGLVPPRTESQIKYWIKSARDLRDACGEFGTAVLETYRREFEQHMAENRGVAPHPVEGPGSLIKMARSTAGRLRLEHQERKTKPTPEELANLLEEYGVDL